MKYVKRFGRRLQSIASWLKKTYLRSYEGTGSAVRMFSELLTAGVLAAASTDLGIPKTASFMLVFFVTVALMELGFKVINWLQKIIFRINIMSIVYALPISLIMAGVIEYGFYETEPIYKYFLYSWICTLIVCLAAASWYGIIRRKARTRLVFIVMAVSTLLSGVIAFVVIHPGKADSYLNPYLELAYESGYNKVTANDKGSEYKVGVIDYGLGDKLNKELTNYRGYENTVIAHDETVDLTSFVSGYSGINRWYRDKCLGYSLLEVPLRGRIYYPIKEGKSPVMFLIHGNHTFITPSYLGYNYLGEYLAKAGYIVVSIDSNACNGSSFSRLRGENDARALLLLEHIDWLEKMCRDSSFTLADSVDFENIILAGHSRGGEAAAIAALFNEYDYYPDDGRIRMDFDYEVKAVVAIAPTVDQYMPSGHEVELEDISYLLIQGANDQDLAEYYGMERYNTVGFSGDRDGLKTSLYIAGANHGQFNELWGRYDLSMPRGIMLNTENLISGEAQQEILKRYVRAFLDTTVLGKEECGRLLYDSRELLEVAQTVYIQNYMDSDFQYICSFEEDSDLATATDERVSVESSGASYWAEGMMYYSETGSSDRRENHALSFWWSNNAEYTMKVKDYDMELPYFQFDICSTDDSAVLDGDYKPVRVGVKLTDVSGNTATLDTEDYGVIYPPLPVRLGKLQYFQSDISLQHQLQTIRIPVEDFVEENPVLDIQHIRSITLCFYDSGRVMIDNIGIGGNIYG